MTMRCTEQDCRYSESTRLPEVQKTVVYLDQNAFSTLFNVRSGGRLPKGHEEFSEEFHRLSQRALHLQQVVFPHSDIHHGETIVFHESQALRQAYEIMGGDARLIDTHEVELMQTIEIATARLEGRLPNLTFDVDEVLTRDRNQWLPDMHITVNADYGRFAPALRRSRDRAHEAMAELVAKWADEKPSFETVLKRELAAYGLSKVRALAGALDAHAAASASGNIEGIINTSGSHIMHEHRVLEMVFERAGIPREECTKQVVDFWLSEEAAKQPLHVIEAHLFAAVARRVSQGQRRFSRGLMNDVRAISAYAPYVDAMFVDKEFEVILNETPQLRRLPIKAQIFSFKSAQAFIDYLTELCGHASADVKRFASRIYGVV